MTTDTVALLDAIYRYGDLMVLGFALVLFFNVAFIAYRVSRQLI